MTETQEEKQNRKYASRKFIVWAVATLFEVAAIAYTFVSKDAELAQNFTTYWGWISLAYIGGNVAQDFITKQKPGTKETVE